MVSAELDDDDDDVFHIDQVSGRIYLDKEIDSDSLPSNIFLLKVNTTHLSNNVITIVTVMIIVYGLDSSDRREQSFQKSVGRGGNRSDRHKRQPTEIRSRFLQRQRVRKHSQRLQRVEGDGHRFGPGGQRRIRLSSSRPQPSIHYRREDRLDNGPESHETGPGAKIEFFVAGLRPRKNTVRHTAKRNGVGVIIYYLKRKQKKSTGNPPVQYCNFVFVRAFQRRVRQPGNNIVGRKRQQSDVRAEQPVHVQNQS